MKKYEKFCSVMHVHYVASLEYVGEIKAPMRQKYLPNLIAIFMFLNIYFCKFNNILLNYKFSSSNFFQNYKFYFK